MPHYAQRHTQPPKTLTLDEQQRLLRVTGEHRDGFRDHVLISLALATGLRAHELLALDHGDVFDDQGRARPRVQLRVFKQSSARPGPQEVVLPRTIRAKLKRLLANKRHDGHDTAPDAPLFRSRKGNRLSTRQLRHLFGVWQERAGFTRRFTVHSLRHTACDRIYRATRDIRLTQRFARHASILTTAIYTHPSDEDLVRAVAQLPC